MPRVLLLIPTTTYRTQAFVEAARNLGVDLTVASEKPSSLEKLNPSGLLTLDLRDPHRAAEQAVTFAAAHPVDAVIAVDDQVTVAAAAIAQALQLRSHQVGSVVAARDKYRSRKLLQAGGVPVPGFQLCCTGAAAALTAERVRFPCVIKPLALSASRGVIRANDRAQFVAAVNRLSNILHTEYGNASIERRPASDVRRRESNHSSLITDHYLVEDFIPGPEFALEGLITNGTLRVLALFEKPDALDGPYFEETLLVTPSRQPESVQRNLSDCAAAATRALGLTHGPVHIELRLGPSSLLHTGDRHAATRQEEGGSEAGSEPVPVFQQAAIRPYVIEVNPRTIGGLCSRALQFGMGMSLESLIIRHALEGDFTAPSLRAGAAGVMMIPIPCGGVLEQVQGVDRAKAVAGVEDVAISIHLGRRLVPLPEGGDYLGFIFARADTSEEVEAVLRKAHARLHFAIDPVPADGRAGQ